MEQLTFLPTPDPNALTRQTRRVERLQRELRAAVLQLERMLPATADQMQKEQHG